MPGGRPPLHIVDPEGNHTTTYIAAAVRGVSYETIRRWARGCKHGFRVINKGEKDALTEILRHLHVVQQLLDRVQDRTLIKDKLREML